MPRHQAKKVPIPTDEEMDVSFRNLREILGFSARNREQLLYLKLAFRTGDTGVVHLDPVRADYLFQLLKKFLPNDGENDGSPVKWASEGLENQKGYLPDRSQS
jgi:hypothetical protein